MDKQLWLSGDIKDSPCVIAASSRIIVYWCCARICAYASMSCHCSSTWPVKTCLHAPDCNNKLLQWQITMYWTAQRWLMFTVKQNDQKWKGLCFPLSKAHWLLCWGSVQQLNGSSRLRAEQPDERDKHLWNVTARLEPSFFSLLSFHNFLPPNSSCHFMLRGLQSTSDSAQVKFHITFLTLCVGVSFLCSNNTTVPRRLFGIL